MTPPPDTPVLWDTEHDTYSDAGDEFMEAMKDAVRPIIAPLTEQFVDALHLGELATEAVRHVCHEEWMRRQDQP